MREEKVVELIKMAAREERRGLDLSGKGIKSLPAEIGKLTKLSGLNLSNNQLTSLPGEIGKLTKLSGLNLYDNQLTSVPAEIGRLTNLRELDVSSNELTSVPPEIGKLRNLRELYLYSNEVKSLPPEVRKLKNLVVLEIGNMGLTRVPPAVRELRMLRQVWLGWNGLTRVPAWVGELTNLRELYLGRNQLTSVPAEIRMLTNLTDLDLSGNQLTSLPAELGNLTKLRRLALEDNPLESPPAEVVGQGTKAVLAYLRELAKGAKKRYEAKMLILGDADEGKTCVSRALRGEPFEHQETTEGVDITPWEFKHPDCPKEKAKKIRLNIWDFEGQEINHQSHQFFLTQRALYLLVFKGREVFDRRRVEYWLDTIRSRAPESEVVLVATECETRTPRVPVEELRARYPGLLKYKNCYFEVGCASKKGVGALRKHIQRRAAKLEVMGAEWPISYARAEKVIRERREKKAHASRISLNRVFKKSGMLKSDYENASRLMGYLGILTHFPDCEDLRKFIVLRPQWLTKAISYVLENKGLEKDKGEITHERLHGLWEEKYPGLAETFHKCMKEFELCYDLEYRNRRLSLVPLRFGFEKPPDIPWSKMPNAKERRIEYRFDVTPPAGIMSRFIVKTHYMIVKTKKMPKGVYWYNGVFLGTGEGENRSEALCEFDVDKRVMSIRVRAAFPQNMVEQLNGFVQAVFSFFEGLKPERYYGCVNVCDGEESQCDGIYTEKRISFALTQRSGLDCEYGYHKVDPLYLVTGITSFGEWQGLEERLRVMLRKEMDKEPEWAEKFGKDIRSILVRVDNIGIEAQGIREQGERLPAEIEQRFRLAWREYWDMLDSMLDNREFNSAPGVVSIVPIDGSGFNPRNWFEKGYVVWPYCEYEGGVHKVGFSVKLKKPRAWWEKTAPKLAFGMKVLSGGIKIACAGLPLGIDAKIFDEIKNEVAFMKELAGHLELEGGAESDICGEAGAFVERTGGRDKLRDLRTLEGEDEKRIVRMQLADLFQAIAPKNYKARQWGELRRVRMADNTYRWLCGEHAKLYER
ncbi:MAG: leucine-rich repeat domain-containing protein [Planctomycetota bacterium]